MEKKYFIIFIIMIISYIKTDSIFDNISDLIDHKNSSKMYLTWQQSDIPSENKILFPKNVNELKNIMNKNSKFRAVGSAHNFTGNQNSELLISTTLLNKVISVDEKKKTITVQAGMEVFELLKILEKYNLALPNLGNYHKQTIVGSIICGTHGTSGKKSKIDTFTSSVLEMKMLTPDGNNVTLHKEDSVNLGLGGIIYEVTLQACDFYYLLEDTKIISINEMNLVSLWNENYFGMIRWTNPHLNDQTIECVTFSKVDSGKYNRFSINRRTDRLMRIITQSLISKSEILCSFCSKYIRYLKKSRKIIDKYYYVYVDDPVPKHTENEYAIQFNDNDINKLNGIVQRIPIILKEMAQLAEPHTLAIEVHVRFSTKDKAKGHLAYMNNVCWFDININSFSGSIYTDSFLSKICKPWDILMRKYDGMSHFNKYTSDKLLNVPNTTKQYFKAFSNKYDPEKKMQTELFLLNGIIES